MAWWGWLVGAALAGGPDAAALRAEMAQDAARSLWAGVDEAYVALAALDVELTVADHVAGFEAARQLGRTREALDRLLAAQAIAPSPEIEGEIERIHAGWGEVELRGSWRRPPRLARERMPFGPDEQRSIQHAQQVVRSAGSFVGLLPAGAYVVGDRPFDVVASGAPVIVDARRPGRGDALPVDEAEGRGAGFEPAFHGPAWLGPAVGLGAGALLSPAGDAASYELAPASVAAAGAQVDAGIEIGFDGVIGVSPKLTWNGGFAGGVVANRGAVGLDLVLRPGRARVTLGPTWGFVGQSGTGVVGSLDRGLDGDPRPNEALGYRGFAFGPGASASFGWTVARRGALALQVVASGAWQGGSRDYGIASLGFAVAPWVEPRR